MLAWLVGLYVQSVLIHKHIVKHIVNGRGNIPLFERTFSSLDLVLLVSIVSAVP